MDTRVYLNNHRHGRLFNKKLMGERPLGVVRTKSREKSKGAFHLEGAQGMNLLMREAIMGVYCRGDTLLMVQD
jgi:hypothetical protein